MNIKIDMRETELIKLLQSRPLEKSSIIIEALPIGDIIFEYLGKEILIIERKSIADLESSIKDGRYEEQSFRLTNSELHNHNIIYLLEGNIHTKPNKTMLYSAMFSLQYYKGFSVVRSFNLEETATIVLNMSNKIQKDLTRVAFYGGKGYKGVTEVTEVTEGKGVNEVVGTSVDIEQVDEPNYCSVVKKVKKDNITPENISEIMLFQIPGISSVSAIAIMKQFKTLQNLLICIKEKPSCLADITYTNAKNQTRKINKTIAANIIKFLL